MVPYASDLVLWWWIAPWGGLTFVVWVIEELNQGSITYKTCTTCVLLTAAPHLLSDCEYSGIVKNMYRKLSLY